MSTLLLRLSAPLQAWGAESKFDTRSTQRMPTKSGVIGMAAAALGRRRNEPIDDLRMLRFGVRIDQEGALLTDFHMAHEEAFWKSGVTSASHLTHRQYLMDATFLVGLEGEDALLYTLENALRAPAFPLFLGRRSCPPAGRLVLGIQKGEPLIKALQAAPWQASGTSRRNRQCPSRLRVFTDADGMEATTVTIRDVPLSFHQAHRMHGFRSMAETLVPAPTPEITDATTHDPLLELEE